MNPYQTDTILSGALSILSGEDSWCQGSLINCTLAGNQYCVMGAINMAISGMHHYCAGYIEVAAAVAAHLPEGHWDGFGANPVGRLVAYNNDPATTVEDVRLLLKKALAAVE